MFARVSGSAVGLTVDYVQDQHRPATSRIAVAAGPPQAGRFLPISQLIPRGPQTFTRPSDLTHSSGGSQRSRMDGAAPESTVMDYRGCRMFRTPPVGGFLSVFVVPQDISANRSQQEESAPGLVDEAAEAASQPSATVGRRPARRRSVSARVVRSPITRHDVSIWGLPHRQEGPRCVSIIRNPSR